MFSFAVSMLGSLFGIILFGSPEQVPSIKVREQVRFPVVIQHRLTAHEFKVPSFVTNVPVEHFAGVSSPMQSLAKARRSAVGDVVRQVLGSINAQYGHRYMDRVSGNVRMRVPDRVVDDRLSVVASGVVLGVERNIVKSSWCRDVYGQYICFILVRYPEKLIADMRRLTKGAKVVASVISNSDNDIKLKVSEVNNVSVVISSAIIRIHRRNRFAKAISFFVWHVPSGSDHSVSVAIGPVQICGGSREIRLALAECTKSILDYLLGAKLERVVVLRGNDELGREVSARVVF